MTHLHGGRSRAHRDELPPTVRRLSALRGARTRIVAWPLRWVLRWAIRPARGWSPQAPGPAASG